MRVMDNLENKPSQDTDHYQQAYQEWEARLGSARTQSRNWALACIASLIVAILLLVGIIMVLAAQKTYVYVAQVSPADNVVNLQPLNNQFVPTQSQEAHVVGLFIHNIMTLPLDPVVARNNWLQAYNVVTGQALQQLTTYAQQNPPFAQLGNQTASVTIKNFNPISRHSYDFTWVQTIYNSNGAVQSENYYEGIFTVVDTGTPNSVQGILENPLGVKIAYFNFKLGGH